MQKLDANVDSVTKGVQTIGGALFVAALFAETSSAGAVIDLLNQTLFDAGDLGTVTNGMAIGLSGFSAYAVVSIFGVRRAKAWLGAVPFLAGSLISTVFLSNTVAGWVSDPATSLAVFTVCSVAFLGTVHRSTLERLNNAG